MTQDYSDHGALKKPLKSTMAGGGGGCKDLSLSLMHHEPPGNLGPFFLIGIIAKECIIR